MARQTAEAAGSILVDGVVVQPSYRSTPWEAEARHAATAQDKVWVCGGGVGGGGIGKEGGRGAMHHHRVCMRATPRHFWHIVRQSTFGPSDCRAVGTVPVDGVVLQPTYRSTPWEADTRHAATAQAKVCVGWVSFEGRVWGGFSSKDEGGGGKCAELTVCCHWTGWVSQR
jgi:hypothetical protein